MSVLRPYIHKLLESSPRADPQGVAEELLKTLDPEDYLDALAETLPGFVRIEVGRWRSRVIGNSPQDFSGGQTSPASHAPRAVGEPDVPTGQAADVAQTVLAGGDREDPAWSVYVSGFQSWADELRRMRVDVGEGAWKFFRDLLREDLEYGAAQDRKRAASCEEQAVKKDKTIAALEEHGVETAGELPDDVLKDIWG